MNINRRDFLKYLSFWAITTWAWLLAWPLVTLASQNTSSRVDNILNKNPDLVKVREYDLPLTRLFPYKHVPVWLKVWIISDPHINEFNSLSIHQLDKILTLDLDILIIAWDFLPEDSDSINEYFSMLDKLTSKMRWRIFAVLWNHDYKMDWNLAYNNIDLLNFLKSRWVILLDNTSENIVINWDKINLFWVWSIIRWGFKKPTFDVSKKDLSILISHEPIWFSLSWDWFDIWVAGHMHWSPDWLIDCAVVRSLIQHWMYWFNEYDYRYNNWLYSLKDKFILTNSWIWRHWFEKFFTQRYIDILTIS